ncbi:hypothetical protein GQX73_g4398 [Xylaria multiplex]|uniref:Uncharacterized protein n=1 Tax=Xylaria multiplex TaxID=323545 RepID=A0A7C8IVT0_9PEZI|nr:hypothetical protein GQX73_g4398 [Xylaria multiplex]
MLPILAVPPIVIGIIGIILGIYETAASHYPTAHPSHTVMRVTVGLDSKDGLHGAGGDMPDVQLFNEVGEFIGKRFKPGKVKSGEYFDITIEHRHKSRQQSSYALLAANGNAICISHITTTWSDGNQYALVGDWGRKCGGTWYYSNIYLLPTGIKPTCLWIDEDTHNFRTGFQVHWPEFSHGEEDPPLDTLEAKEAKANYLCTAGPPFTMHEHPNSHTNKIAFWVPKDRNGSRSEDENRVVASAYGVSRRQIKSRDDNSTTNKFSTQALLDMSLVVSDDESHSAEELCGSPTSVGPDFFNSLTGSFCRMSEKTVWPACGRGNATNNCFNDVVNQLVINGVAARDEPYAKVVDWTSKK